MIFFICSCQLLVIPSFSKNLHFDILINYTKKNYDQATLARVEQWVNLIRQSLSLNEFDKLYVANDFFNNNIRFSSDLSIWQQADYWATPLETLNKTAGDCEDFSLAKYVSLLNMGVPSEKLRLVYVQARIAGSKKPIAHMVLAYYPDPNASPYILDNLVQTITRAENRKDLNPVFSFNAASLWVTGKSKAYDSQQRLSKWQNALERINDQGLIVN